jgi:hypothetical protein
VKFRKADSGNSTLVFRPTLVHTAKEESFSLAGQMYSGAAPDPTWGIWHCLILCIADALPKGIAEIHAARL